MIGDWKEHFKYGTVNSKMDYFINNVMFKNREYTFIDKKHKTAKCSMCGKEYTLDFSIKHNDVLNCPYCGNETVAKSIGYGRKGLENADCLYWFSKSAKDHKALVCYGYLIRKDYEDYKNPKIYHELQAIYVFGNKESSMWRYEWWGRGLVKRSSIFDFNIWGLNKFFCYLDKNNLKESIKGTYLEHANFEDYGTNKSLVRVLDKYTKYPWLEQMYKAGFTAIANEVIDSTTYARTLNFKGKRIYDVLKMKKGEVNKLDTDKSNITSLLLGLYQEKVKRNDNISNEELKDLYERLRWVEYLEDFIELSKYSSMKKLYKYIAKQTDKKESGYKSLSDTLLRYRDYLKSAKFLEMDLKDKHVLFPKNIFISHDNLNRQIKLTENKIIDERIKKRALNLDKYKFVSGRYLIRAFTNSKEIIEEGKQLDHCVAAHYMKPYANGETILLCVRNIEYKDKPLVTVEVKNRKVVQAYGIHDTRPPKDILEFLDKYKKEVLSKLVKKVA